jgi:hypothetical protein
LCGPKGAFIINVVDMIFSNPWGHLEGLEAIEELSIASIHALTIFDLENIRELLKHY